MYLNRFVLLSVHVNTSWNHVTSSKIQMIWSSGSRGQVGMIIVYSEKYNLHNKSNEVRDDILFDKVIIEPGASWVDQATWNRRKQQQARFQLLEFI